MFNKVSGKPVSYHISDSYIENEIFNSNTIIPSDTIIQNNKSPGEQKSDQFYDSLKTKANKKPLTRELHDLLLNSIEKSKGQFLMYSQVNPHFYYIITVLLNQ
jgi:hypothetical protein